MSLGPDRRTALLTAVAMTAFAANSLLCRGALGSGRIDPVTFTTIRIVSGGAVLVALASRRSAGMRPGSWPSALALFGYAILFSLAYVRIPTGVGALLLFGAVQVTMIGQAIAGGARPRQLEWLGLLIALTGLVVLTRPGLEAPDARGSLLMASAGVAWGIYTLRGKGAQDPLAVTAGNFVRACLPALALQALATSSVAPHWSIEGVLLAAASGALASGVGYAIWYTALAGLTPTRAAIVQLSAPLLAAIGGVVLLGEAVTGRLVVASPLLLGGIWIALLSHRRA